MCSTNVFSKCVNEVLNLSLTCPSSASCIKGEGFSYMGFHTCIFTLGRNYKGSDEFSRIMLLVLTGLDSSLRIVDKCTSMGAGFGLKAFTVPQNIKGIYEMKGSSAMLHITNMIVSG